MNTLPIISDEPPLNIRRNGFRLPAMRGIMERRVLLNYRCDPDVLAGIVPAPFRPKLVRGFGMAGICLIRLRNVRPASLPATVGVASDNAAHRIAVEWDENGVRREGVFIPRRDSNSFLNCLAGGRLFPGVHHAATFQAMETGSRIKIEMRSNDGVSFVRLSARLSDRLPKASIFNSLDEASEFFLNGMVGWSRGPKSEVLEGMELKCDSWRLEPLAMEHVVSSLFDDPKIFPKGTTAFDSAFIMRDIQHTWHSHGQLVTGKEKR